jgi:hypothetical protein
MDHPDDLDPRHTLDEAERRAEASRTAHTERMASLEAIIARQDESLRRLDEQLQHNPLPSPEELQARHEAERAAHEQHMAEMAALRARLDALVTKTQHPASFETTVTRVRGWSTEEKHPNWFMAAYADLAQRLIAMDARLGDIEENIRMIIGQLAFLREQDEERDADGPAPTP